MYGSIHTHFESQYDTGNDLREMLLSFQKCGAKKVAATEHGVFSSFEDLQHEIGELKKNGLWTGDLEIIPGIEAYFKASDTSPKAHLILVAKDYEGYLSLCRIITESGRHVNDKGDHDNIVTWENLENNVKKGHLICTSACIAGPFGGLFGLDRHREEEAINKSRSVLEERGYFGALDIVEAHDRDAALLKEIKPTEKEKRAANKAHDEEKINELNRNEARAKEIQERLDNDTEYASSKAIVKSCKRTVTTLQKHEENLRQIDERDVNALSREYYDHFINIFGKDDFYFEIQNHGIPIEETVYNRVVSFAIEMGNHNFIASNDIHIGATKDQKDLLENFKLRRLVSQFRRFNKYLPPQTGDDELYIKDDDELREALLKTIKPAGGLSAEEIVDIAIGNIENVLKDCSVVFPEHQNHYPKFSDDENRTFEELLNVGIQKKFGGKLPSPEYEERLKKEIDVIERMGYAGYHLIVQDYLEYGRLLGFLRSPEEVENAPLSIEELDRYITDREYPRIGYSIGPGRGCVTKGTLIYTKDGLVPVEKIKTGDIVYTHTGKLKEVLGTFKYPVKKNEDLYKIFCYYGDCFGNAYTENHKIYAVKQINETNKMKIAQGIRYKNLPENVRPSWIQVKDLIEGDLVYVPKFESTNKEITFDLSAYAEKNDIVKETVINEFCITNKEYSCSIRGISKDLGIARNTVRKIFEGYHTKQDDIVISYLKKHGFTPDSWRQHIKEQRAKTINRYINAGPDMMYMLGLMTGNGWVSRNKNEVGVCFNKNRIPDRFDKGIFGLKFHTEQGRGKNVVSYVIHSRILKKFMLSFWEGYDHDAKTKTFPDWVFDLPDDCKWAFINGLWDTDGSHKDKSKYTSSSWKLTEKIKRLLCILNVPNGLAFRKAHNNPGEKVEHFQDGTVRLRYTDVPSGVGHSSDSWQITVPHNFNEIMREFGEQRNDFVLKRIRKIEKVHENYVYDISVKSDHSYVTSGFTAHNSAAGSLCCYLLGITDLDPVEHGLIFERFLNPERVSMPDIDSDFRPDIRERVVQYCSAKYGKDNICKIMTKSYAKTKGAIETAARFMGSREFESADTDVTDVKIWLKEKGWYKRADALSKAFDAEYPEPKDQDKPFPADKYAVLDSVDKSIVDLATTLTGMFMNYGQHAAGVIISADNVGQSLPLMWNDNGLETQCTMGHAEQKGFLKMDFLGLDNLNTITEVLQHPSKGGLDHTLNDYGLRKKMMEDKQLYEEIFCKGLTQGVFQFESDGMKKMLREFKPERFEDLIILVAAYRPGPIKYIPEIIDTKWHEKYPDDERYGKIEKSITLNNDDLKEILTPTYGVPIYQEQVMEIFRKMAGYSLGQADLVRRAMSKKKTKEIAMEKQAFIYGDPERNIDGCIKKQNMTAKEADDLFEQIRPFGNYGFNKSHAAAYALVALFTAYEKLYHPLDFYKATLNADRTGYDKYADLMKEMKALGIKLLPPSLEFHRSEFSVDDGGIRFGFRSIKNCPDFDGEGSDVLLYFMRCNPTVSDTAIEKYIKLGLFRGIYKGKTACRQAQEYARVKGNRHAILAFFKEHGKEMRAYIKEVEKRNNLMEQRASSDNPRSFDKKIADSQEKINNFKSNLAMYIADTIEPETEKEVLESRTWETESMMTTFLIEGSMKAIRNSTNKRDFSCLENADCVVPAIVLKTGSPKKTKTGNTYYPVTLMDINGNVIDRRFEKPPEWTEGLFKLPSEEHRFFSVKESDMNLVDKSRDNIDQSKKNKDPVMMVSEGCSIKTEDVGGRAELCFSRDDPGDKGDYE